MPEERESEDVMRGIVGKTILATAVVVALLATSASAAVTVYEGKGVGKTRLGWNDKKTAKAISSKYKMTKDTSYSYVVYHWYVGKRMSNKRYPIELYAKKNHKVYRYHVNSPSFVTARGIKVGSSVESLREAYDNESGPRTSGNYKVFRIKHSASYTEFYCKGGKVNFIVIRR